ncbi:SphA family protein [Geotalea toluenoxydans]|uniref:SphA family protein n=1 Tax=Geotalea toluenoxydans TaxID=421624 RepID=UPI0006D07119|nr:transporter [Geotalea toluenoxydans]
MKLVKGLVFVCLATLVLVQPAWAFNSSSFNGTADFYAGAAPPPGLHLIDYNVYMDIRKVENKGQGLTDGAGTLTAIAFRPIYVMEKGLLGGNLLFHSIIPLLSMEANVTAQTPGGPITVQGHDGGLGDIYFGIGNAWHTPVWHWLTVLDVITPTGHFDPNKPMNVGNNAFVIEPVVAVTGLFANGFETSAKLMYSIPTKNSDYIEPGTGLKGYQTGQAIHMDYNVNYALTKDFKLGVTGWIWQGLESDEIGGVKRHDTKDFEFSMGPAMRYQNGKFGLVGKYVVPISAENRIEANQLWIDLIYSF